MTKSRRKELMANLEAAIRYHRANPPARCDAKYARDLALRFGVNKRTMRTALNEMAQRGIK